MRKPFSIGEHFGRVNPSWTPEEFFRQKEAFYVGSAEIILPGLALFLKDQNRNGVSDEILGWWHGKGEIPLIDIPTLAPFYPEARADYGFSRHKYDMMLLDLEPNDSYCWSTIADQACASGFISGEDRNKAMTALRNRVKKHSSGGIYATEIWQSLVKNRPIVLESLRVWRALGRPGPLMQ